MTKKINRHTILLCISLLPCRLFAEENNTQSITDYTPNQIASALGWVNQPKANQCHGYYIEPDLGNQNTTIEEKTDDDQTLTILADGGSGELTPDGFSQLDGHVKITQIGRQVTADEAKFDRDPKTGKIKTIDMKGHVVLREPSKITVGDHILITPEPHQGVYDDVLYRLALSMQNIGLEKINDTEYKVTGLVAEGKAKQIRETNQAHYVLNHATYSTCPPTHAFWHLSSSKIDLDHETGRGKSRNTTIYVKSVPVFYSPFLNFPIDKRRATGFLSPTYSSSSQGGFSLAAPFYWNLAPNYDMTIKPDYFSKRGLLTTTDNRFITDKSSGEVIASLIPHDQAFDTFKINAPIEYANSPQAPDISRLQGDSTTRWDYSIQDKTRFSPYLTGKINYARVSDDYMQQDFNLHSDTTGQFLQQGVLTYTQNYWNAQLLLQQYQTLHPVTLLSNLNQYSRMPDMSFNANYPQQRHINYLLNAETVNFSRNLNPGEVFPSASGNPTSGERTHFQPGMTFPFIASYGYFKPSVLMDLTAYNLANQPSGYNENITRAVPIYDIDTGLTFDRNTHLFSHAYQQTLEPRLFYLNVPYRSQYQIPVFDTSTQGFTFDQLFQTNRFNGIDRIGDADQLSAAVTTRFLDEQTGEEKSKFGIGRIFYRSPREVMLCGTQGCQDSLYTVGATSPSEPASPIAGFGTYAINQAWNVNANMAWDPRTSQTNNGSLTFQYKPAANHLINVGYNFMQYGDPFTTPTPSSPADSKNNLNMITTSAAWPLTQAMEGMAGVNYNISHSHFQTFFYGLSYNACCYAFRAGMSRNFYALSGTGSPQYNRQIVFQLVLKGLGGVGQNSTMNAINSNVTGYEDLFNKNVY